ncbi:MAG: hypothetical protein HKN40_04515 [Winogradskyella sp.]|uniref:hypothetical protein n=1 Tax=Winogradskyella sp. TaxID=1883156 RepID=UPI0017AE57FC|nr:hypothetical protein [Winogradskyella sp.]
MSKPFRNTILILVLVVSLPLLFFKSCVIYKPEPEDCKKITTTITALREGPTFDIGFSGKQGERYYINRGIESGLILDSLKSKVLNKTVTLHIVELAFGSTRHIAQLALDDEIIYTEFDTIN